MDTEFRKVASFKPLMENYKTQLADHESKAASRAKEVEALKWDLEQVKTKLKVSSLNPSVVVVLMPCPCSWRKSSETKIRRP